MRERKNNKFMLGFLIGIVIAVIIIILLCFANVITFKENHNLGIDITGLKFNDTEVKDMVQENIYIGGDGIQSIYKVYSYNVNLYFSGKVKITTIDIEDNYSSTTKYLSNIDDAVDIIQFSVAGDIDENLIYILLSNGDVYYYRVGDSINGKYSATKVKDISGVKKLCIYNYPALPNSGGSWAILAITHDEVVQLNMDSV